MKHKTYMTVSTTIFAIVCVAHLVRAAAGIDVMIGGWALPLWASWLAVLIAGYMAYSGYTTKR
jgi:hypothetical protein